MTWAVRFEEVSKRYRGGGPRYASLRHDVSAGFRRIGRWLSGQREEPKGTLALGALNVYYRDFRYALPLGVQLWMFASPVAYPLTKLPADWQLLYAVLNPVAGPLEGFRRVLGLGTLPSAELLAVSAAGGLVWLWLGYRLFKAMEPNFADVI